MAISIERIADVKNKLGEGPVWDVAEQALYWIDGAAPAIYRLDPQTNAVKEWKTPKAIGSFAIRQNGGAICALSDGFYTFDLNSGAATPIPDGLVAKAGTNFNDGKTDARSESIHGPSSKRHSQRIRQQEQRLDAPINDIAHLETMGKKRNEN